MREPRHPFATRTRHSGPDSSGRARGGANDRPRDPRRDPARCPSRLPRLLDDLVRQAVAEIAGARRRLVPRAVARTGDRVAYVTDRSGIPRLEVAPLDGGTPDGAVRVRPRRSSRSPGRRTATGWPTWSAPAARSARELHVVRPDGSDHRVVAGEDPRATVFAGGWTGAGRLRLLDRPRRRPGRRRRAGRRGHRRAAHAGHRRLPVGHLGVRRRALRAGPPRPARLPAHRRRSTSPPACSAGCSPLDAPGGIASEDGRFGPDGRSVYLRASLPGEPVRRPGRPGRASRCREDGVPGEGRVVLRRPDADLDGYALRTDGTVLAVWNVGGVTELLVHDLVRRRRRAADRAARAGDAGLVAVGRRRDDARRADRSAQPARRCGSSRSTATGGAGAAAARRRAAPTPRLLVDAGPPRLRRARRAAAVGLALRARAACTGPTARWSASTAGRRARSGRRTRRSRRAWSPPGSPCSPRTCAARAGFGRAFMAADDGPAREASFDDVRTTVERAGRRRHRRARAGSARTAGPTAAT